MTAAVGLLAAAVAMYAAVQIIEAIWVPLLVIFAVVAMGWAAVWWFRRTHRGW